MQDSRADSASRPFFPPISLASPMPALFLAILMLPLANSLVYSTLEMEAISQLGEPVEGVYFFLQCKMTVATVERYLCTSNLNGTCKSPCMDCSDEEGAQIRATYGNQTVLQEILLWKGNETCKAFYEPAVPLGTFIFEVEEVEEPETEEEAEGAEENLPENTNIETRDFYLGETEEDYEYVSYLDEGEGAEQETCPSAFILVSLFFLFFSKSSKK